MNGTATYRERMALSPQAVFEATLEDVSRMDAPGRIIAHTRRRNPGQVPISFEIPYNLKRITAGKRYLVRASILENGRVIFTGRQTYLTTPHSREREVMVLLRRTSGRPGRGIRS